MALFGPSEKDLKQTAKKEFERAAALTGDSRKENAYRMRIALRARGHIDKLFVEAASKVAEYNDVVMLNISQGKKSPEPPKAGQYMKLMTASGEVWSFLPEEYADLVFKYGMQYQGVQISGATAINNVQKISNAVGMELKIKNSLIALEFLRQNLADEGIDVDAEIAALDDNESDDLL